MKKLILSLLLLSPSFSYGQNAYVSKCGQLLFFKTNGAITAVNSAPTVTLNGQPLTLSTPIWDNGNNYQPWVAYALPSPLKNTDVLTWSAPAGWITSSSPIPAPQQNIVNYSGQLEPDFVGPQTMQLGAVLTTCVNYFATYSIQSNIARNLTNNWGNATSIDANSNGLPKTFNNGNATQLLWTGYGANEIDSYGYPCLTGQYFVIWNDSNPNSPTNITLTSTNPDVVIKLLNHTNGTPLSGTLANCMNTYSITYNSSPANYALGLSVNLINSNNINSASNLRIYPPGNKINISNALEPEAHLLSMLQKPSGALRYVQNTGGNGNTVNIDGYPSANTFPWGGQYAFSFYNIQSPSITHSAQPVVKVGPLTSKIIYTEQAYGLPNQAVFAAPPGSPGPYQFTIPAGWPNQGTPNPAGWIAFEVTTAAPHNFKTGHLVRLGNIPPLENYQVPVFVTSPTSFATFSYLSGPVTAASYSGYAYGLIPDLGELPFEMTTQVSSRSGAKHWVNIPPFATDACVSAIATRVLNTYPAGSKIYIEYMNEAWNFGYPSSIFNAALANLEGNSFNYVSFYVNRAGQIHNIFTNIFTAAGRQNELVRVIGSWATSPQYTTWCTSMGWHFDAVAIAPYYSVPDFMTAPANNVIAGTYTMSMYLDLLRHCYLYDTKQASDLAGHMAAIQANSPGTMLVGYEGGPDQMVPGVVGNLAAQLQHDVVYSPGFYDCEQALYRAYQNGGMSSVNVFNLCDLRHGLYYWGMTSWMGQQAGLGLNNTFCIINKGDGKAHDATNQSVRLKAWQDWCKASLKAPPLKKKAA